ncbi:radical SAM protein [Paenibacillus sp. GbtcB18]|uniref:SPL family radical SAM protein n=1 Tax=Paenibacillus sp. GbtcB18 TaxID=2824763 RepID=UPI001C2F1DCC|nr:radical SAM protein [Paenibacillus sp. GbtcB18]
MNPVRYEKITAKQVLNPVKTPAMPFEHSINPYRGCQHGCSFCYARAMHAFLGLNGDDTFQTNILMKENAPEALREQLRKAARSRKGLAGIGRIAIGTATDPYQQAEGRAKLTRGCLEVLTEYPVPLTITTRSPLILRDLDLLRKLPVYAVNISLNTLNRTTWRNFEPGAPSPAKRLETVRALTDAGIPAGIFMAPMLPYITDGRDELEELIAAAAEHGAQFVMASYLRLSVSDVKVWFFETIRRHYPQLVGKYARLYASSPYAPREYRDPVRRYVDELLERYGLRDMDEEEEAPRPGERAAAGAAASGRSSGKPLEIPWQPPAGSPGNACGGCPAASAAVGAGAAASAGAVASAGAAADGGYTGAAGDSASRSGLAGGSRTARQGAGTPGAAQAVAAAAGTPAEAGTPLALEPGSPPAQLVFSF